MAGDDEILSPELAAARERIAAAKAKIEAAAKAEADAKALREALDEAALFEAQAEHGEIGDGLATVLTGAGRVIVRRPTSARWKLVEAAAASTNKAKLEEASKALVLDHLVHPDRAAYFALVDRYPALPGRLVEMIGLLAQGGAKALAGE